MLFEQPKTIGFLIDLSLRQYQGRRLLDLTKKALIEVALGLAEDDVFYLYHPEAIDRQFTEGTRVGVLGNYDTDGAKFDLMMAMKQTLFIVASGDPDGERSLCLFTDRLNQDRIAALKRAIRINEKEGYEVRLIVVGIGDNYDRELVAETCGDKAIFIHVDAPADISSSLTFLIGEHDPSKDPLGDNPAPEL